MIMIPRLGSPPRWEGLPNIASPVYGMSLIQLKELDRDWNRYNKWRSFLKEVPRCEWLRRTKAGNPETRIW